MWRAPVEKPRRRQAGPVDRCTQAYGRGRSAAPAGRGVAAAAAAAAWALGHGPKFRSGLSIRSGDLLIGLGPHKNSSDG
jgi:hypothetical protein